MAALGLVAGLASTAAALDFSVTGRYQVDGYLLNNANGNGMVLQDGTAAAPVGSDAYFLQSFKMAPILTINDHLKMVSDVWLADNNVWGSGQDAEAVQGGPGVNSNVEIWQLYLQYMSPAGELRIGRQLGSTVFGTSFLDTITRADGIEWRPSFLERGPWSTVLKYEKLGEADGNITGNAALNGVATPDNADTNQDSDYYEIDLFHKSGRGLGSARLGYLNNQDSVELGAQDQKEWDLTAAGQYNLPGCYLNTEIDFRYGKKEFEGQPDLDIRKLAAFLQVGKKIGALDVSAMYIYAGGDDNTNTTDTAAAEGTGLGNEFEPYYILTGSQTGIFNTEFAYGDQINQDAREAGLHSFGAQANYAMSNRLMLHGAVAYSMAANKPSGYDKSYGIEYNIGAAYKLLSNLTYEVHFGYLDTGDFFKGYHQAASTKNVFLASNHLTMTF